MTTKTKTITATFEYSGLPDYWQGNGRRWDDDAGCAFAFFGPTTTVREFFEQWATDDGDFQDKEPWEDVTSEDVFDALVALANEDDVVLDSISEIARLYGDANGHDYSLEGDDVERTCDCCVGDGDPPFAVILLKVEEEVK